MSSDKKTKTISAKFISTSGPVLPKPGKGKSRVAELPDEDDVEPGPSKAAIPAQATQPKGKPKSIFAQRMAQKAELKKQAAGAGAGSSGGGGTNRNNLGDTSSKSKSQSPSLSHQYQSSVGLRGQQDKLTNEIQALMRDTGVIQHGDTVSSEDILKMRDEIMKSMSKNSMEFLKSKMVRNDKNVRLGPRHGPTQKLSKAKEEPKSDLVENNSKIQDQNQGQGNNELPIDPDIVKNIPHMDEVEIPKLEWTMNIRSSANAAPDPGTKGQGEVSSTGESLQPDTQARFDLSGNLIDASRVSDSTWLQGLHHHGEDMDKPGYTFEELLSYARSSVASQRTFALNAMAGVFKNAHEGSYDTVLTLNPLDLLKNVDVISVVRKSIDFDDMVTLDAAFSCLSAILFPTTEEECYDLVYLYPDSKPFLWHKVAVDSHANIANDPTTRDHQILQIDLLSFLIDRSHLLDRIEYLLVDRPDRVSQAVEISMLQILIRIARHSPSRLLESHSLLNHIVKIVMSCDWSAISIVPHKKPLADPELANCNPLAICVWLAMKLFRVIVESNYENASQVHKRYDIMSFVITYLASSYQYGLQSCCHAKFIILESFRFWSSSLDLGLGINEFSTIFPILALSLRHYCEPDALKNIGVFDGYYIAQVFHFLSCILICGERKFTSIGNEENAWTLVKDLEFFVLTITMNILQVLTTVREDWTLALAGRGLEFLTIALRWGKLDQRKGAIVEHVKQLDFSEIAASLQQHSVILNMSKIKSRYPSNFISSSAILTSSSVNYAVGKRSPFQFYKPWLNFLQELNCVSQVFIPKVWEYLELLADSYPLEYFETYYIRFEQLFLFKLLSMAKIEEVPLSILVHLICTLSKSDMYLFKGLIRLIVDRIGVTIVPTVSENETEQNEQNDSPNPTPTSSDHQNLKKAIVNLYMSCYFPNGGIPDEADNDNEATLTISDGKPPVNTEMLLAKPMLFQSFGVKLVNGKFWMLEPLSRLARRYANHRGDLRKYLLLVLNETRTCLYFIQYFLNEPSVFVGAPDIISYYVRITQIFSMGEEVFLEPSIEFLLCNLLRGLVALWENVDMTKQPQPFTNFKPGPDLSPLSSFKDYYEELAREFESLSYCSNVFSAYLLFPLIPTEAREIKLLFWSMQGLQFVRIGLHNNLLPPDYLTKEVETDRALLQLYTILLVKTNTINRNNNELLFHVLDYHVTRGLPVEDMQKVMKLS